MTELDDPRFLQLQEVYSAYDDKIFIPVNAIWIVVAEKPKKVWSTENHYSHVVNPRFTRYTANKLKVLCIINKLTGDQIDQVKSWHWDKTVYKVGEKTHTYFSTDKGGCISYFTSLAGAFYYHYPKGYDGVIKVYDWNNGRFIREYVNKRVDTASSYECDNVDLSDDEEFDEPVDNVGYMEVHPLN